MQEDSRHITSGDERHKSRNEKDVSATTVKIKQWKISLAFLSSPSSRASLSFLLPSLFPCLMVKNRLLSESMVSSAKNIISHSLETTQSCISLFFQRRNRDNKKPGRKVPSFDRNTVGITHFLQPNFKCLEQSTCMLNVNTHQSQREETTDSQRIR